MLLITGSYPPSVCGVGDYTARLLDTDGALTSGWQLYYRTKWGLSTLAQHIKAINRTGEQVINLQYPTQGYGWSLVPHLLCVYYSWFTSKRFSVTLHEQSQLSLKARWAQKIIIFTANRIIFTNEFERLYAAKRTPCIKRRSTVVKIFSNISSAKHIRSIPDRRIDLVNFGHIRPNKGLEKFIEAASALSDRYKVCIAGQVPEGYDDYFLKIETAAKNANIEIRLNLLNEAVSDLLNDTKVVYLPFPDGVSERRGSLLASFANGAVVATTTGQFTTKELADAVIDIDKTVISDILNNEELLYKKQIDELNFMKNQMPNSWNEVVSQYNNFLK